MPRPSTCRECGRPITDRVSLLYRVGPDCRKALTGEELAAALRLTTEERKPGYIPPEKRASLEATLNNRAARRTIEEAAAPVTCARHGGIVGKCPTCVLEEDVAYGVGVIIRAIQAERRAARDAANAAAQAGRHAA